MTDSRRVKIIKKTVLLELQYYISIGDSGQDYPQIMPCVVLPECSRLPVFGRGILEGLHKQILLRCRAFPQAIQGAWQPIRSPQTEMCFERVVIDESWNVDELWVRNAWTCMMNRWMRMTFWWETTKCLGCDPHKWYHLSFNSAPFLL